MGKILPTCYFGQRRSLPMGSLRAIKNNYPNFGNLESLALFLRCTVHSNLTTDQKGRPFRSLPVWIPMTVEPRQKCTDKRLTFSTYCWMFLNNIGGLRRGICLDLRLYATAFTYQGRAIPGAWLIMELHLFLVLYLVSYHRRDWWQPSYQQLLLCRGKWCQQVSVANYILYKPSGWHQLILLFKPVIIQPLSPSPV